MQVQITGQLVSCVADSFEDESDKLINYYYFVLRDPVSSALYRFKTNKEQYEIGSSRLDESVTVLVDFSSGSERNTSPRIVGFAE